jgi:hypothetical protein
MTDGGVSVSSQAGESASQQKFWRHHIQAWQTSGLSQRAYCQKNNIKEYRFSKWKNRLVKDNCASHFVRVALPVPVPIKRGMQVFSPNGFRVDIEEGFDPVLLKKLLSVIGEV